MTEQDDARHQTYANLDSLWSSGNPQILPVSGEPWCEIRLDPQAGEASLRTAYQTPEPDLAKLRHVSFEAVAEDGVEIAIVTARADDNINGAYGLLAAIADGIQVDGLDLAVAAAAAVERYKDVLSQRSAFSEQVEIGLFGELTFLVHLMQRIGPDAAIDSWLGPLSEEHDFVLPGIHVEVKTTASERRRHVISGLSQLVSLGDIPLVLFSVQVTRAPAGTGRTLPALIGEARHAAAAFGVGLDLKLGRQGWNPEDADLYQSAWVLRSIPRAYLVDDAFPAITADRIDGVIPSLSLVSDVSYRVDVTDLEDEPLPEPYTWFGFPEEI